LIISFLDYYDLVKQKGTFVNDFVLFIKISLLLNKNKKN